MAAKIEMTRVELNRIGKSCQLADVDIVKMSQELDEIIVEYMRQQLQTMKSNKPTAASNRLSVDICTKPDSH